MKVVFLSPHFPLEMPHFTRGLHEVGVEVHGLGDVPLGAIPAAVRRHLHGYIQVPQLLDEASTLHHALPALRRLQPDRVECLWEVGVVLAARLREALGMPGLAVQDAIDFRDKERMKQRLDRAGLEVPRHVRATTKAEVLRAAEAIGFPLIIKPIDGAGARDTFRVDTSEQLDTVVRGLGHLEELAVETFIEGEEFTYDTLCLDGEPVFDSIAQYHPKPLESRSLEWISPAQIVLRDPHIPGLQDAVKFGRQVLRVMGVTTGFTHMEWFRRPDGGIVFGEIAARAPGGRLVDQMNFANDIDLYREWARVLCHGRFDTTAHRRYHVAAVFKRAQGQGRIREVTGLTEARRRLGSALVVEDLLPLGTPRRDWRQTLLSDGCLMARHSDYATTVAMMGILVRDVNLYAG